MTTIATSKVPRRMQHAATRPDPLFKHVRALHDFSSAVMTLAEFAPERMTLAQGVFFLLAAAADIAGRPATFTTVKEAAGPRVNRSLHTTYKVLLDEGRKRGEKREDGLGWLTREENKADQREKYLRLTPKGREVVRELVVASTGDEAL